MYYRGGAAGAYKSAEDDSGGTPESDIDNVLMGNEPSDDDAPTDAEVSKYSFCQCLVHYLEGEHISERNRKAVELVFLFEAGTHV